VSLADVLLPNSHSELKRIKACFPQAAGKRMAVVRNAVDEKVFDPAVVSVDPEIEKYRGAILCVARIEGLKNQLNLVRACNGLPWPLLLIGQPGPNHRAFYEKIKAEAGPNIKLLGSIDHNLLPQYYKVARVHCLISWMETTGLSSLEAGIMGNNIVVSTRGDVRDYFKDFAYYCEPDSVESIRRAVIKAYESPVDPGLVQLIRENYTWAKAAEVYRREYLIALGEKPAGTGAVVLAK
jgi:glycosyltransferase involved in cell wall biosynthesis